MASSLKNGQGPEGIGRQRRPVGRSLVVIGLIGVAILSVGWALVGWPVLVAAAVAAMVVRFA
jgi:hypothetical protein